MLYGFATFRYKTRWKLCNAWVWCLLACSIGSVVKNYIALYIGFPSGDKQNVTKLNVTKLNVTKIESFRYSQPARAVDFVTAARGAGSPGSEFRYSAGSARPRRSPGHCGQARVFWKATERPRTQNVTKKDAV